VTPLTPLAAASRMESPASQGTDISRLTTALAVGDEEAFREFHGAYFDRLLRYLIVVTRGDEEAARDALQETFTRIVRHARRFDSEETFWSWLTVLARSAATDGGRKRRSYWRLLTSYAFSWMNSSAATESVDADERLHFLLVEGLGELRTEDRALIEGKYLRGASVRELAAETNLTEKAVESRLSRLRRQLREHLLERLKNEEAD
jgi:RNA polymerase sigma-70 factor (ECF subfamily)